MMRIAVNNQRDRKSAGVDLHNASASPRIEEVVAPDDAHGIGYGHTHLDREAEVDADRIPTMTRTHFHHPWSDIPSLPSPRAASDWEEEYVVAADRVACPHCHYTDADPPLPRPDIVARAIAVTTTNWWHRLWRPRPLRQRPKMDCPSPKKEVLLPKTAAPTRPESDCDHRGDWLSLAVEEEVIPPSCAPFHCSPKRPKSQRPVGFQNQFPPALGYSLGLVKDATTFQSRRNDLKKMLEYLSTNERSQFKKDEIW
jgi:hypothetical protein